MAFIIVIIFSLVWYLPLFIKHRKNNKEPIKYYIFAFLLGVLAFIPVLIIQFGAGFALYKLGVKTNAFIAMINVLVIVAITEEMAKFLLGNIVLKRVPNLNEASAALIIGAAGLGFEVLESILASGNVVTAIIRGLTMLHLFFQLWMGKYYYRAKTMKNIDNKAYKKNMALAFIVPILVHFIFDYLLALSGYMPKSVDKDMAMLAFGLIAIIIGITYIVITYKTILKSIREEKNIKEANDINC